MELQKKTVDEELEDLFREFKGLDEEQVFLAPLYNSKVVNMQKQEGENPLNYIQPCLPDKEAVKDPWNFRMWDIEQKYFIFENNDLIAIPLDSTTPEQLMTVVPNDNLDFKNRPIFMGLTGKTKVLSCLKSTTGEPQLVILEKNIMDLYRDTKELKNFSFYVFTRGSKSACCFESAAFPGWFLSTSIHSNMPVGLCKPGGPKIILFHFEKVASTPK